MADTEKSEQPQTNGLENGLDEDERNKMRPADIDADVKEMERRKRVEMIMSSKLFREELERIIELQLKDGNGPAGLLQQISDMMGIQSGKLHTPHMFRGSNCVTPINDIRGVESMGYEKGEKNLRCKLASVFRLMDLYGWSQGINNQITARLNQDEEHFLVNPHGMLFNEITASSLVKVDMQGNIVEPGTTNFSVNTQGFLLHSAIHASRPDVNCVIHIKTPSVLAVSSLKCGLLPVCQEALVIGEVSQHPFVCGVFEPEEREKIIRNLGPHNKVLLLHNHGAVCCGATIEEAFYNVYNTVLACETQMKLMPIGVENLLLVSDETRKQVYDAAHRPPDVSISGDKKKFRVGEMEFEALIRMLDNAGFRTGYIYRHPLVKGELPKPKNDVEVPPAVSSLGYLIEQEELYKQGNWKKYIDGRNRLDRTKWLNSPNVYQKVEILETGTADPKKITKWVDQNSEEWVAESSPTHSSTPVKIDSALQFVPKGTNPKEFKKLQQQIKENRRADKITSGPQSHILEGVSWEEAKKLQDANITQTGDQVILVGAASKGIIQRNYQHNALVYKTPYAKNPFDSMSDKEIEDYKQLVERKQRGDTDYEESQSESEAISSSRQDGLRRFKSPLLSPQSATSETEEESRDEPRVLRIETKTAPRPIQAEVVLSDAESDTTDARVERSHSARYPKAEKPESVTLMNSFRKSWSLKREKDKSKDVETYESGNLHSSLILKDCEQDRMDSLHCCVARIKQLTHRPLIVDVCAKVTRPLLKSASDPCNLSTLNDDTGSEEDNRLAGGSRDPNTSLSCDNIVSTSELQQRLHMRKKMLHSAKMKFLGYHRTSSEQTNEAKDKTPTSPMCALISEIRETISEIMSPERSVTLEDSDNYFSSLRWIDRPKFVSRSSDSELKSKEKFEGLKSKVSLSKSFSNLSNDDLQFPSETFREFKNDFQVLKLDLENSERSDTSNCNCAIHRGNKNPVENIKPRFDESQNEEKPVENVVTEIVKFVNASDEEATYTITDDSLLQTYSFTESTETEWYYNKTIMKLENSQTVLEIKETENKEENLDPPAVKYIDTGIDTDFTSEKENESKNEEPPAEEPKETLEITEEMDGDAPVCESSALNKSSETSGSGRTSNDVDTSFAFKTETENSERASDKSPEKSSRSMEEKKKFLEEMLRKTKEPIEEESSDSVEANENEKEDPTESQMEKQTEASHPKLSDIPESPEFTNIDTEDAPVTSSSKDTSPEVASATGQRTEEEPSDTTKDPEVDLEGEKENVKPEQKRKKNVKSSTKITVKKELKEKDAKEPIVSEIRLTIKNRSANCQSEKYEVKIQDVTNTSEDLSRSVSSGDSFVQNVDSYESIEIVDKSCECDAQQSLEELQGEVMSTVEKLHTIEDYFEDEIKKHSSIGSEKTRNGSDECTIEYNYREFEEVLNESQGEITGLEEVSETPEVPFSVEDTSTIQQRNKNTEFFISSPLGDIRAEIELCDDADGIELSSVLCEEYEKDNTPGQDMEELAMSSAFVAAILSEAVLEENICMNGSQQFVSGETTNESGGILEMFCNVQELADAVVSETASTEQEAVVVELFAEIIDGLKLEEKSSKEENTNEHLLVDEIQHEGANTELPQKQPDENHINIPGEVRENENVIENQEYDEQVCQLSTAATDTVNGKESKEGQAEKSDLSCAHQLNECEGFAETVNCEQPKDDASEITINTEELNSQNKIQSVGGFGDVLNSEQVTELKNELGNVLEVSEQDNSEHQLEVSNSFACAETDSQFFIDSFLSADDGLSNGDISESFQYCQQALEENDCIISEENYYQQEDHDSKMEHDTCEPPLTENCDSVVEHHDGLQLPEGNCHSKDYQNDEQQVLEESGKLEEEHNNCQELQDDDKQDQNVCQQHLQENSDPTQEHKDCEQLPEDSNYPKDDNNDYQQPLEVTSEGTTKEHLPDENSCFKDELIDCQPLEVIGKLKEEETECQNLQNGNDCIEENQNDCQQSSERNCDVPMKEQFPEEYNCSEDKKNDPLGQTSELRDEHAHQEPLEESKGLRDEQDHQLLLEENHNPNCQQLQEENNNTRNEQQTSQLPLESNSLQLQQLPTIIEETYIPKQESHILTLTRILFPTPLKAITYEPHNITLFEGTSDSTPVEYILNYLLNSVIEKRRKTLTSMNDVINFIVTNEESPTDSLAEFEDMENIISLSSSVVADIIDSIESQMEGEVESLPDEEMKEIDGGHVEKRKRKKGDSMFKVTIATPTKKEIFINYSLDYSSTFNTSTDSGDLCNSYIKTDDVNEDFENFSSDNPDFFSVGSSGKNSLNSSFCSAEGHVTAQQFCCVGCEDTGLKSPRSLAIIQEVDEGDSSTSSEAGVPSNPD